MLRAIIIDDEPAGIETLKILASRNAAYIRVIASSVKAEEGITLIEDYKPDVVFLDISMPSMNGFELLSKLTYDEFCLVFTTAHKEFAIQAIKSRAFDYLLKPVDEDDFATCIAKIRAARKPALAKHFPNLYIEIHVKDGVIYLRQKDIVRLEASRSYTEIYMEGGIKHIASRSIGDFEPKLDPETFFRCHKSHIVNLQKIQKFVNHEGFYLLMNDGSMPDLSRSLKEELQQRLKII